MTRTSKTLFLTLAALVCLHTACTAARADDSSGGVINNGLFLSSGFSNPAGSSSGIIATNGNGLFVSDLYLGGVTDGGLINTGTIEINGGSIDISDGAFLMISSVNFFALETNGLFNLTGSLDGSGTLTSAGVVAPEPATWLLAGLGLLLLLRTHKSRRPSA